MRRIFHLFEPTNGYIPVGLVEDGVPKAMTLVPEELYDIEDEEDAYEFTVAVVAAFGQQYPLTDEQKDKPWVD